MVLVLIVFFQFGIRPLLRTYLPECVPSRAESLGASINWLGFIVVSLITKTSLGLNGTFMVFALYCSIISGFGALFLNETKGKTRDQVIAEFRENPEAPLFSRVTDLASSLHY